MLPTKPALVTCKPIAPLGCIHSPQPCFCPAKLPLFNFFNAFDRDLLCSTPGEKVPLDINKLISYFDIFVLEKDNLTILLLAHYCKLIIYFDHNYHQINHFLFKSDFPYNIKSYFKIYIISRVAMLT